MYVGSDGSTWLAAWPQITDSLLGVRCDQGITGDNQGVCSPRVSYAVASYDVHPDSACAQPLAEARGTPGNSYVLVQTTGDPSIYAQVFNVGGAYTDSFYGPNRTDSCTDAVTRNPCSTTYSPWGNVVANTCGTGGVTDCTSTTAGCLAQTPPSFALTYYQVLAKVADVPFLPIQ